MWAIVPAAAFAAVGCVARSPDEALPELEVTLRYLRTEKLTTFGAQDTRYMDVFELQNHTDARIRCTVLSSGEVVGTVEVLAADNTWQDESSRICVFGSHRTIVEPGESAEVRRFSWLRLSRFSLDVGVLSEQAFNDARTYPVRWITATTEPYDSSLAAPGAEPVLTWRERAHAK